MYNVNAINEKRAKGWAQLSLKVSYRWCNGGEDEDEDHDSEEDKYQS